MIHRIAIISLLLVACGGDAGTPLNPVGVDASIDPDGFVAPTADTSTPPKPGAAWDGTGVCGSECETNADCPRVRPKCEARVTPYQCLPSLGSVATLRSGWSLGYGYCTGDDQCPVGQACPTIRGIMACTAGCQNDIDCGNGQVCVEGGCSYCRPNDPQACGEGQACQRSNYAFCQPKCGDDEDCRARGTSMFCAE